MGVFWSFLLHWSFGCIFFTLYHKSFFICNIASSGLAFLFLKIIDLQCNVIEYFYGMVSIYSRNMKG